jgi:DNA-binding MarR family transcriptional regulator
MSDVPAPQPDVPATSANVPLNDRQHWVLEQIRAGVELHRQDIEKRFRVTQKTAKQDLSDLVGRGLIVFERTPRPGHYRLVTKEAQAVRRIRSRNTESCNVGSENASTKPCNEGSNERQLTRFFAMWAKNRAGEHMNS